LEIGEHVGGKRIGAQTTDKLHPAAGTRGPDGLVGALAAESTAEDAPRNGLSGPRQALDLHDQIHVGTADNDDIRTHKRKKNLTQNRFLPVYRPAAGRAGDRKPSTRFLHSTAQEKDEVGSLKHGWVVSHTEIYPLGFENNKYGVAVPNFELNNSVMKDANFLNFF
jgi:hypothetical protein